MIISKEKTIEELRQLLQERQEVRGSVHYTGNLDLVDSSSYFAWRTKLLVFIRATKLDIPDIVTRIESLDKESYDNCEEIGKQIESLIYFLEQNIITISATENANWNSELENIFNKFHVIARQLRTRYNHRNTLEIQDEYDVQDLLHALLLLHFDDVRAEEWTPSNAGGCARVDFLLKDYQTFIEVKKTRQSMTEKELGEQLIVDCEKYRSHPDCKKLYCFVYDPERYLGNPIGIRNDLEKAHKGFIKVFINQNNS